MIRWQQRSRPRYRGGGRPQVDELVWAPVLFAGIVAASLLLLVLTYV
ncbi:hypothetical protein KCV87_12800 [Actinosynnema pretiosum subsp. pretiosum]|uniref:Uncharacterized protein n=2 Tax=Actinosynnema TaxID=40566 RepID=C6WAL2_ACTMD|nr:hypothetical protein [Actinosynnema mirum]ACU35479.1 hypothetical protein Amir_1528 [Actinosynnema mirum DSM 43827]AXX28854.1 hypothetical protein APASM_1489 [Actinosynnema pretiosum subsp. pretiosum]QUF06843.1 hypothetical protein KCV87_12800 [Actinosynnema pretiosum subsp. pretiosum]